MRRTSLLVALLCLSGCIDYELNPDAGVDAGEDLRDASWNIPDGSHEGLPDGGWNGYPDGGWFPIPDGGTLPDAGYAYGNCDPNQPKGLCFRPGEPGDAGEPWQPEPGWPGSMENGDPGAAVLFLVRIERGTVNLADRYAVMIDEALVELSNVGIRVNAWAVASLYTGEFVWTPYLGMSTRDAIVEAASLAEPMASRPCTVDPLAAIARELPSRSDRTGALPFYAPFSAFAVYVIDSGARPYAPDMAACAQEGQHPSAYFGADPAHWLVNVEARSLPRAQVRFLSVYTPEGITSAEAKQLCARMGMPQGTLDVIEASPVSFYVPFGDGLSAGQPGYWTGGDFCSAYTSFVPRARGFAKDWRKVLERQPPWP